MTKPIITIRNTSGAVLTGLRLIAGEEIELRIYSNVAVTDCFINACRVDFGEQAAAGEDANTSRGNGQEIIDEDMILGKPAGGEWQSIAGGDSAINCGAITENGYVSFSIKTVIPADAESVGVVGLGLCVSIATEEDPGEGEGEGEL